MQLDVVGASLERRLTLPVDVGNLVVAIGRGDGTKPTLI